MKKSRKIAAFLLAFVVCFTSVVPVQAAETVKDSITLTMTTDKESYSTDETISATVTLKNDNEYSVSNVSLEGSVPDGYTMQMAENESTTIEKLDAGAEATFQVSFVPDASDDNTDNDTAGSTDVEEGIKIFTADFEEDNPFTIVDRGVHTIIQTDSTDGTEHGKVMEFKRKEGDNQTFYMEYTGVGKNTTSVVYEFDVKLLDGEHTFLHMMLKDGANWDNPVKIKADQLLGNNDSGGSLTELASLNDDTWYTVSVVCNYKEKTFDVYLDGTKLKTNDNLTLKENFNVGETTATSVQILRFFVEDSGTISHFMMDNVRVYEGTKPYEGELIVPEREPIEINYNKSIFNRSKLDTSKFPEMLEGYISLHTRNGMVYQNGTWTRMATMPVETESGFLVVAEEICKALNISYVEDGSAATINGKTAEVTEREGKLWIDAQYFFETILEKKVAVDTEAKSDGMMIAGDETFSFPSAERFSADTASNLRSELQNLNDYLFFERPSYDKIYEAYQASDLSGKHPRIMASAEDFAKIKKDAATNPYMSRWYQQLLVEADVLVEDDTTPLKYELRDGYRLLGVANDALNNMYVLGMAYQLTGEKKYAERAWVDLEAISNFKDWYAIPLDPATFCAAVAIGYDWMYQAFDEEQRALIEEAMYYNGYTLACDEYMGYSTLLDRTVVSYNQCAIINCGFAMAGLAFMDVYPEESAYIVSNAVRAADINLTEFGPDGAYSEGAGYWAYTMSYVVKLLSTLETIYGTCFSLDLCEGLSTTADYMMNVQTNLGIFNYNDASQTFYYAPEFYYLSDKYDDPSVTSAMLYMYEGKLQGSAEASDLALSLLYLDASVEVNEASLPGFDKAYWGEGLVTLRDRWSDETTTFVGIHGGYNQIIHGQLDAGTFVYEYANVRWIKELGKTPYDTSVSGSYSVTGNRWRLFRSKAEAHSTIVIVNDETTSTGTDQVINAGATLKRFDSDKTSAIAVLELTDVYAQGAKSATRGFFYTDDRSSIVVRDEISLIKDNSTVYSFFLTDAAVEIAQDGKSAILTQNGKQVKLEFVTEGNGVATLDCGPATREMLGTESPIDAPVTNNENEYDVEDAAVNRIYVKLEKASGDVAITVKLTPIGVKSSSIEEYNSSIDNWTLRGGEIAAKPEILSVTVDGREMNFNSSNQATFLSVEGKRETVPEAIVKVDETKYTYQVTDAESMDGGTTSIVVSDKTDPNVFTTYIVNFLEIPEPKEFEGMNSLQVVNVEASDEPQAIYGYYRWNVLDNDTDSRWTSQGGGNWILLELEEETTVDNLMISFIKTKGKPRSAYFGINVSTDGENWELVWSGKSALTDESGLYEQFDLGGRTAKYIRLDCNGNTEQGISAGWNNIAEIVFTQNIKETDTTPAPTPTPDPEPTPAPDTDTDDDAEEDDNASNDNSSDDNVSAEVSEATATETGDDSALSAWGVLAILALAGATVIAIRYRKRFTRMVSVMLACVLMTGIFAGTLQVQAEGSEGSEEKTLEVSETITVGEETLTFGVKVTYTIDETVPATEYEKIMAAYSNSLLWSEDFDDCDECPDGTAVHTNENKPEDAYYYAEPKTGTIQFVGANGYVQFDNGNSTGNDRIDIKLGDNCVGMKYILLEYKVGYKKDTNARLDLYGRGSAGGKLGCIGIFDKGVLKDYQGKVLAKDLEADKLYKVTYVLDVDAQKCDVYLDGVKVTESPVAYEGKFDEIISDSSLRLYAYNSGIMVDDIKVYGSTSTTNPNKDGATEYAAVMTAYEDYYLWSEDFNDCTDGAPVHDDKHVPAGEYYYAVIGSISGTIQFVRTNGYVKLDNADNAYNKIEILLGDNYVGMKYVLLEYKVGYNKEGARLDLYGRGSAKEGCIGIFEDGQLKDYKEEKVLAEGLEAGRLYTVTYVLYVDEKRCDVYLDGVKVTENNTVAYSYNFDEIVSASSLRLYAYNSGIMVDDIKVYGSTADPTASTE